ncbi:MAG: hypothetical protein JSU78_05815 [Deltaproteobacteria bacterium]|nr:MAG: hypothetical protein JSU78_05815 [Deltaproteobacteria bacterium]
MNGEIDFKEVYKELQPKILHYLYRMTGHDEVEDIAQEVFEKVSRSLEGFRVIHMFWSECFNSSSTNLKISCAVL